MTIRLMSENDADIVRNIDALAFGAWYKQLKGEAAKLPIRKRTHILALLKKDPEGCFIAEEEGREVGFIFSRTWGTIGWFGTFAVLSEYQGSGIGKRLIAASLDYLRREPKRVIGLETMPESPFNLGLYLKRGFQPRFLTLLLNKNLEPSTGIKTELPYWSQVNQATWRRWLADLREAANGIYPGLDYTKEIISMAGYGFGETLVLTNDSRAIGMSIVRLMSSRENWDEEQANIQILTMHPDYTNEETFHSLLDATETLARAQGKQKIALPVNGQHIWALERLLGWGYLVDRAMVRMVLGPTDEGPSTDDFVNLVRWAG